MNATTLEEYCRQRYNAVNDTFFSQAELWKAMEEGQMELATKARVIRGVYSSTSVASQREYDYPTRAISIARIEYDGAKLEPISWDEDDKVTLGDTDTTDTGTPAFYTLWNDIIYLRPTPSTDSLTIKVYTYDRPRALSSGDLTLDIPIEYHYDLSYFVLHYMAIKDTNPKMADYYVKQWDKVIENALSWQRKKERGNRMRRVQTEYGNVFTSSYRG